MGTVGLLVEPATPQENAGMWVARKVDRSHPGCAPLSLIEALNKLGHYDIAWSTYRITAAAPTTSYSPPARKPELGRRNSRLAAAVRSIHCVEGYPAISSTLKPKPPASSGSDMTQAFIRPPG